LKPLERIEKTIDDDIPDIFMYTLEKGSCQIVFLENMHIVNPRYQPFYDKIVKFYAENKDSFFFFEGIDFKALSTLKTKNDNEERIKIFLLKIIEIKDKADRPKLTELKIDFPKKFMTADISYEKFIEMSAKDDFDEENQECVDNLRDKYMIDLRNDVSVDIILRNVENNPTEKKFIIVYGKAHSNGFLSLLREKGWVLMKKELFYSGEEC
jgi:hypothetical protein